MSVQVYGCNHVAIEVGDIKKAVAFYQDLFDLMKLDEGDHLIGVATCREGDDVLLESWDGRVWREHNPLD